MKYLLTTIITTIASVTFLYYLFTNQNFLPLQPSGEYNWFNIITLTTLLVITVFSLLNIIIFAILKLINKDKEENNKKKIIYKTIKVSLYITTGLLLVFILNLFSLLNWIWGLTVLIVVLIALLII